MILERLTRWLWIGSAACVLLPAGAGLASEPVKGSPLPALEALHAATSDADRLAELTRVERTGGAQAARAVELFLREGQSDAVSDRGLEALGNLAQSASLDVLQLFAGHRRVGARTRAYAALAKLRGSAADAAIARGLRDAAPEVRALSARTLGDRGAKVALDVLWSALGRGVPEAASAIGKLGDATHVKQLHAYVGKIPLDQLLDGYQAFVCRKELNDTIKLEIVATLEEVSGNSVHARLRHWLGRADCRQSSRVQRAILVSSARTRPAVRTPQAASQPAAPGAKP